MTVIERRLSNKANLTERRTTTGATAEAKEKLTGTPSLQAGIWNHNASSWWDVVKSNVPKIAEARFGSVWLPPPSASADRNGYLPTEWYNFKSNYGTEEQLRALTATLNDAGVMPLADIVANHRVGNKDWADFVNPWLPPEAVVREDEWPGAKGGPDTGLTVGYARDLDHRNPVVLETMAERMQRIRALGFKGARWDFAVGYAADVVGKYVRDAGIEPELSVGEVWTNLDLNNSNPHRQRIVEWIDGTGGASGAFDFTTKGILQHAVAHQEFWRLRDSEGKPSGVIGWYPDRAWTFLDNHDTGFAPAGQEHWPFPGARVDQGYAYLMTHPGTPMVFWPHFFDWGEGLQNTIRSLIAVREEMGIHATSKVDIRAAEQGLYAAVTEGVHGQLAVKLGSRDWNPGAGWTIAVTGKDFAVWKKAA